MAGMSPHYFPHIPMHVVPRHLFMYYVGKSSTHLKKKKARNLIFCRKTCEGDADVSSCEPKASRNEFGCALPEDLKGGCRTVLLGPISSKREKKDLFHLQAIWKNDRRVVFCKHFVVTLLSPVSREELPFSSLLFHHLLIPILWKYWLCKPL